MRTADSACVEVLLLKNVRRCERARWSSYSCPDRISGRGTAQRTEGIPGGNEAAGAAIVAGKGMCLTCHSVQGKGSRLGPDLTDIGALRTVEQLMTSLVEPDAEILPENRFYRVVSRDGAATSGRLLNLDTFQVLLLDEKEQLRSFQKSELREHGFIKTRNAVVSRAALSSGARGRRRVPEHAERSRRPMTARRLVIFVVAAGTRRNLVAQVSPDRILNAQKEPHNWLTYSGSYLSQRYSQLTQITPGEREGSRVEVGLPGPLAGLLPGDAARRRRSHVHDAGQRRASRWMRRPGRYSGSIPTRRPRMPDSAADELPAASRFTATRCFSPPLMRT